MNGDMPGSRYLAAMTTLLLALGMLGSLPKKAYAGMFPFPQNTYITDDLQGMRTLSQHIDTPFATSPRYDILDISLNKTKPGIDPWSESILWWRSNHDGQIVGGQRILGDGDEFPDKFQTTVWGDYTSIMSPEDDGARAGETISPIFHSLNNVSDLNDDTFWYAHTTPDPLTYRGYEGTQWIQAEVDVDSQVVPVPGAVKLGLAGFATYGLSRLLRRKSPEVAEAVA